MNKRDDNKRVVIVGGGPAGLTAAYDLTKHGVKPRVFEKLDLVGGISCTQEYKGYRFDMGGHRFFTKSKAVRQMWDEVMGETFLLRPRKSRIFYRSKFFDYPLKPGNALKGLGFFNAVLIVLSYMRWQILPYRKVESFEHWVTNRFGKRLFNTFFKTYTEKVWGIPCSELKAEWAAQRIKNLSMRSAVKSMFFKPKDTITSLIEQFHYPKHGPGMMWNMFRSLIDERGGQVQMNSDVVRLNRDGQRLTSVVVAKDGVEEVVEADAFISSMPVSEFLKKLDPPPPPDVLEAAHKLKYRDFLTVCLIIDKAEIFDDNWIYIHDPTVHVGRIQNFKNWSPFMLPDESKTSLGLEYFCNEGDELWTTPDEDLIALGKVEVEKIGLARGADVEDGCVFRVPKSYPVYDSDYTEFMGTIRDYVNSFENFQTIGRNGLHRYNNQDHAMLTGMLAVRNLMLGESNNLWVVNAEQEYHEEIKDLEDDDAEEGESSRPPVAAER